jgi:hypothetical protein
MKSAAVRTVTGVTVMAAVASAMLLAIGGDSGTPSRFELDTETGTGLGPALRPVPAVGAPAPRPAARPGSAASPAPAY